MKIYNSLTQKFSQTYPATKIYYHTCKFTRRLFCSPLRRCTYSPSGLAMKIEHHHQLQLAALEICRVYFYLCPITKRWFTTRKPSSRYSPESKSITHQATLEYARQHRQVDEVKEKETQRRARRKEYFKLYHQRRREAQQ